MGDRGNIKVITGVGEPVIFYGHWSGYGLPESLQAGLIRARGTGRFANDNRWNDGPYLARCIFQAMIGEDTGNTGFAVSTVVLDNEYPIIVLDASDQTVHLADYDWQSGAMTDRDKCWPMAEVADAPDPAKLLGWHDDEAPK
jgi:hypothetical protein